MHFHGAHFDETTRWYTRVGGRSQGDSSVSCTGQLLPTEDPNPRHGPAGRHRAPQASGVGVGTSDLGHPEGDTLS